MIKTFIGVALGQDICANLSRMLESLRGRFPRVRWVDPEGLQITLKFIGDVPPMELSELFAVAGDGCAQVEPFECEISGLGVFPNAESPRVIWAGCDAEGGAALARLAAAVEGECAKLGYPLERRAYHAHITLGRVKKPADAAGLAEFLAEKGTQPFGALDVNEVTMYMSERAKRGSLYSPMQRIPLGKNE